MRTFTTIFIFVIAAGLLGFGGYYLYQKSQKKPVIYGSVSPEFRTIVKKTVANGAIEPRQEVEIKPKASGIVNQLFVEAGQMVKVGDVLGRVTIIPNMVSLANAEARLEMAQITVKDAQNNYDRFKNLLDDGVMSPAEFQPYESTLRNAQAELRAAENNVEIVKSGKTKSTANTTNTLIRSTISGMVLEVPVEVGNSVIEASTMNTGTTIATVADMNKMIFRGKVDESEVGKITEGMELVLTVGAIESEKFTAKLEHIAPKGIEENGAIQFEIKAAVKLSSDQFIRAGYSANADIVLQKKDSVLSIPEKLVLFENDKTFVEIETGSQKYEKREVVLGISDAIYTEVLEGIMETDKIKDPIPVEEEDENNSKE